MTQQNALNKRDSCPVSSVNDVRPLQLDLGPLSVKALKILNLKLGMKSIFFPL